MTLPIQRDGLVLPVSDALVALLDQMFTDLESSLPVADIEAITFNFRDPTYSPEDGGYHPVEIRLSRQPQSSTFHFEYLTDFSFVGSGWNAELAKEIDFDLVWGKCEVRYCPPVDLVDAAAFYQTFEENFLSYYQMGVFTPTVTLKMSD